MKSIKFIAVLVLIFLFCLPATGEKRAKRMPMKELTDPKSHNYVPYPYPKNRTEIIADLMHYIKRHVVRSGDGSYESYIDVGDGSDPDGILMDLLNPQSDYKIGEIFKVKNHIAEIPDNYSWLIIIMHRDGNVALRFAMHATGLMSMYGAEVAVDSFAISPKRRAINERRRKVITEADVRNIVSEASVGFGDNNEIKEVQLTAYLCRMAYLKYPIWKIKMADGTVYYYAQNWDMLFSVDKKITWKRKKEGYRPDKRALVPRSSLYLADTLNDELVVLKEICRNK